MKQFSVFDFLTDEQVQQAWKLFIKCDIEKKSFHDEMVKMLKPLMPEINKKLGQENNIDFIAYAVEYIFLRHERSK